MVAVRTALLSLAAREARGRGASWAARVSRAVLAAAVLLAALTALGLPVPGLSSLQGRLLPVLTATAGLLLLGPLLARLAPWLLRAAPAALARRLEDEHGWKDAATTALALERQAGSGEGHAGRAGPAPGGPGPVGACLLREAGRLLAGVPPGPPPAAVGGRRLRLLLSTLFALALLLPGVRGTLGERGAGRGREAGPGFRPEPGASGEDADEWLRRNGRVSLLHRDLSRPAADDLVALARTARALPVPYEGVLTLVWDDVERGRLGPVRGDAGARLAAEGEVRLAAVEGLAPYLTPGVHRARVRLSPTRGPFTVALLSEEVEVRIPPPEGGGGGPPPPTPPPGGASDPPPPPPAPEPAPPPAPEPGPPEPERARESVVTPLVDPGETVRKERALVAAPDPQGGRVPPPVPLAEALADLPRAVERAVAAERVTPRDRPFLERYFRLLRQVAGAGAPR